MVHPGGLFLQKRNTFQGIPFFSLSLEFPEISVPFVHTFSTWVIRASSVLLSYIEGKPCQWMMITRFTDEMWMLQQPKKGTENSIQMVSAPMWAFSSLSVIKVKKE